jgi:UDP-3-O-[3-hydroxymyristoyl] N-acetylglucosamine deacetylase
MHQHTIAKMAVISGTAVHSANQVTMSILPAPANHGIVFKRVDLNSNNMIRAIYDAVIDTTMCTVIANDTGAKVMTVEHLMAALWGCGIDNAIIEVDNVEIPIMDGSSLLFVESILNAGIKKQSARRRSINLPYTISVECGEKSITLEPADHFSIECVIEFDHQTIGLQSFNFDSKTDSFTDLVAPARTFGFRKDLEKMRKLGLARGASLENVIGLDEHGVMNKEGLRYANEFARHKVLDCIGDFALAGAQINAKITANKPGHQLNNQVLKKLFSILEFKSSANISPSLNIMQLQQVF